MWEKIAFEVTGVSARGKLRAQKLERVDFLQAKRALSSHDFFVFQNNPAYLTVKDKSNNTVNIYANGKLVFFFRDIRSGQLFATRFLKALNGGV